jgi:hypothetical protein
MEVPQVTEDIDLTEEQLRLLSFLADDDEIALAAVAGDDLDVLIAFRLARILDDGQGFETVELTLQGRTFVEHNL